MTLQEAIAVSRALNVPIIIQRGMTISQFMRDIAWTLPAMSPPTIRQRATALLPPIPEEERAIRIRLLPKALQEELTIQRTERLRTKRELAKTEEIYLDSTSINLVEHTVLAQLEKYLWLNYPLQVVEVLGKLLQQSITKQWYLERITGLEPLEKLMLQTYMQAFMEFPACMNVLGLRVTPLTMFVLRHRPSSLYMMYSQLKQDIMSKSLLLSATLRKQELKGVLAGKSRQEYVPRKQNVAVTEDTTEDTETSMGRDLKGHDVFWTMLRYAYGMPFWIRRWIARETGMPETHKYAKYFGIGCIPTRRGRTSWKTRQYDEYSGFLYSRDEKIRKYIIWREMHNVGTPHKGRYGGQRVWTRQSKRRTAMFPPYRTVP